MSKSRCNHLKLLSILLILALQCSIFTPEEEEQIRREATETAQVQQNPLAPATNITLLPKDEATQAPTATLESQSAEPTEEKVCKWIQIDSTEALGTGGGAAGMSATRDGDLILTSNTHTGNMGCDEQTFVTSHYWDGLRDDFFPGVEYHLTVNLVWRLEGEPECTSLTAGAKTAVMIGATTIEVGQSTINVSAEPDGDLSFTGKFTLPEGVEGNQFKITAHGSTGSLGGNIFYTYEYQCFVP